MTEKVLEAITAGKYDVIILNYANTDMVGHTGIFEAAVKAAETIDSCLEKVVEAVLAQGGIVIVTADHGNAEQMLDIPNSRLRHIRPILFLLYLYPNKNCCKKRQLPDIAPTMLQLLGLPKPPEMTGTSLLIYPDAKKVRRRHDL